MQPHDDPSAHWNRIYSDKQAEELSWFEAVPAVSLELLEMAAIAPPARVIDVGGGASRLADCLLERGYQSITVVDLAESALATSRARLAARQHDIHWIVGDVLTADLGGPFDLWHDRAVFHFLTSAEDRQRYVEKLRTSLGLGGHAIVATFADDGPERCSGLPVMRYSPEALHAQLGSGFVLLHHRREVHTTPAGREQRFVHCLFQRC